MAFLLDGSALVAERDQARIMRVRPGAQPVEAARVPGVVPAGEGGLLGLAVSPTFETDNLVYAYLTAGTDNRIVWFRLGRSRCAAGGPDGHPEGDHPQRRAHRVRSGRQALRGRR